MKRLLVLALMTFSLLTLTGCISFDYEGETATVVDNEVKFLIKAEDMPKNVKYENLGQAVAYGNSENITYEDITKKMTKEAEKRGANAVIITSHQILPKSKKTTPTKGSITNPTDSETGPSMHQIQSDFDGGYGRASIRSKTPGKGASSLDRRSYRRIVRANFVVIDETTIPEKTENSVENKEKIDINEILD